MENPEDVILSSRFYAYFDILFRQILIKHKSTDEKQTKPKEQQTKVDYMKIRLSYALFTLEIVCVVKDASCGLLT